MLSISIKLDGLDLLPGKPEVQAAIKKALRQAGGAISGQARMNLSGRFVRIRSGKLARGMRVRVDQQGQAFIATVRNVVFYGHILEGGWMPRTSRSAAQPLLGPGGKRAKLFLFDAGGQRIVGTFVRPRPWFSSAVRAALPQLERIFERELGAVITRRGIMLPRVA